MYHKSFVRKSEKIGHKLGWRFQSYGREFLTNPILDQTTQRVILILSGPLQR